MKAHESSDFLASSTKMPLPLADKLALVTGASGSIGSAVAKRLAQDGASVLVHYGSSQPKAAAVVRQIEDAGGAAEALGADLSRHDGPAALIAQFDRAFGGKYMGRLDVLVNNAGGLVYTPLMETSDDDFDRVFNVNVRAMFQLTREGARRMVAAGWGRIINMGSIFGAGAYLPGLSTYCGSKFAVQGLTRGWSRDLGPRGVTVNNVQPAVIQPEPWPTSGPVFDSMKQFTSVGRFGRPEEIAEAVAFLASPKAGFINGESLTVDGGWSA